MKTSLVRFYVLFFVLFIGFGAIGFRLIQMQWRPDARLVQLAESKQRWSERKESESLLTSRGGILDVRQRQLALSLISQSFFANPRLIENPRSVAFKLSPHLDLSTERIEELLTQDRFFVWLQREVDEEHARRIHALDLPGVQSSKESKRIYPHGDLGRSILGIAGRDGVGLEGVEKSYDSWLQASDQASDLGLRDALGRLLLFRDFDRQWFEGHDLVLNLDLQLQKIVEEELSETLKRTNAISAQAVMMEPRTGAILAMASVDGPRAEPSFFRNRVISDIYEPGSTFKVITALGAMEHLHMGRTSQIYAEEGVLRIGAQTVREYNRRQYAWLTLEEMLAVSSNVAAAKLGMQIGSKTFADFIRKFKIGERTGVDLPGEAGGIFRPAASWRPIDLANISFGQGIAVTPLQILRVFAAVANGGYLVTPRIVNRIQTVDEDPRVVWEPELDRTEILTPETARLMTEMLTHVTRSGGTGARASIDGFDIAGKTGTSQKVVDKEVNGKKIRTYSSTESIASFVGYVPAQDPAFVLLVLYDSPEGAASGGFTAAPSFQRIARRSLGALGISSPQRTVSGPIEQVDGSQFIGRRFQDVLHEIRTWEPHQQSRVELFGFGKAIREENEGEHLRIYFE